MDAVGTTTGRAMTAQLETTNDDAARRGAPTRRIAGLLLAAGLAVAGLTVPSVAAAADEPVGRPTRAILTPPPSVLGQDGAPVEGAPVLVLLEDPADREASAELSDQIAEGGGNVRRELEHAGLLAATMDARTALDLLDEPGVAAVVPDERLTVSASPTPHPAIAATGAPAGWPNAGAGRTVAVLDTGVDLGHPSLSDKVVAAGCFSSEGSYVDPTYGPVVIEPACAGGTPELLGAPCDVEGCEHGTAVAGVAAGRTGGTTTGVGGVAPGADLAAVQVFSELTDSDCPTGCAVSFTSDVLAALDWLAEIAVDIDLAAVNLSLGSFDDTMCTAQHGKSIVQALVNQGVPVIAAAGNEHDPHSVAWPACLSNTIAVAASHPSLGGWSVPETAVFNGGAKIAVAAPGLRVPAPVIGTSSWALWDGTSFASPAVAGAAAAWRARKPTAALSQFLPSVTSGTVPDLRNGRRYARLWLPKLTSANTPAMHRFEKATVQGRTVVLQGWALDLDGAKPNVRILVDGRPVKQLGPNARRADVASFFGGGVDGYSGWNHTVSVGAGTRRVCVQVADPGTSTWHSNACTNVVVK